jgi:hypothetical protein
VKKPYFYIIKHLPSQKYYAGCKFNLKADSSDFMTEKGYQTTSKVIWSLIQKDGLSSFEIIRLKHFNTLNEALSYEMRFLIKINAAKNEMFYNRHNGGKNFVNNGGYKLPESTKQKMRKPKSKETVEKQNKEKRTRSKDVYKKAVETRKQRYPTWHTQEQIERVKQHNATWWNEQNRKKHSEKMKEVHKLNPISEETREKHRIKSTGENNPMYGKSHSEESKQKMKMAWQKRKELKQNK